MSTGAPEQQVSDRVLTVPNALSAARLLGVPVFLWAILTERDGLALVLLFLAGLTDYLDGKIARKYDLVSRVGPAARPGRRPALHRLDPARPRLARDHPVVARRRAVRPRGVHGRRRAHREAARLARPAGALRRQGRHLQPALRLPAAAARRGRRHAGHASPSRSAGRSPGGAPRCTGSPASCMPCSCASSSPPSSGRCRRDPPRTARPAPRRVDDAAHHDARSARSTPATPRPPTGARRRAGRAPPRCAHPCSSSPRVLIGLLVGRRLLQPHHRQQAPLPGPRRPHRPRSRTAAREVDALTAQAATLQGQVTALEAEQLGSDALADPQPRARGHGRRRARCRARASRSPSTTRPASGADDAAEGGARPQQGRVIAKDLQFVTNALWESGAEAVSINGKRLTSTSAIRFAGSAIIVDFRPLTRPYVITALGDPQALPGGLRRRRRRHLPVDAAQHLRHPGRHRGLRRPHRPGRGGPDHALRPQRGYWGATPSPGTTPSPTATAERSPP